MNDPDNEPRGSLYDPIPADDAAPEDNRPVAVQAHGPKRLWTIPELCTWAAMRHHAAVDAVSSDYDPEGAHHLDANLFLSDCYGAHVALWFAANEAGLPTRQDAYGSLPELFENAALTVFGLLYDKGELVQIPPPIWSLGRTLTHSELRGSWCAYGNPADHSGGRWWSKLRVPSAEVMRVWEPLPDEVANGRPATSETAEDIAERPRPRRIATPKVTLQSKVEAALIEMFPPKGEVSGISIARLRKRLAGEKKIHCGDDVIRRAMGLKK